MFVVAITQVSGLLHADHIWSNQRRSPARSRRTPARPTLSDAPHGRSTRPTPQRMRAVAEQHQQLACPNMFTTSTARTIVAIAARHRRDIAKPMMTITNIHVTIPLMMLAVVPYVKHMRSSQVLD